VKLSQIQEARYDNAQHFYDWVVKQFEILQRATRSSPGNEIEIDPDDVSEAVRQISNKFGPPNESDLNTGNIIEWTWEQHFDKYKMLISVVAPCEEGEDFASIDVSRFNK
jgi:hypothetical protein